VDEIVSSAKDKRLDNEHMFDYAKLHLNRKSQDDDILQTDKILQSLDNPRIIEKLKRRI